MKSIHVAVPTYNRPSLLNNTLRQIEAQKGVKTTVYVYDDGSEPPATGNAIITRFDENRGRKRYWQTATQIFADAKNEDWDYFLWIPDDLKFTPASFKRVVTLWERIADPYKGVLCPFVDSRGLAVQWGSHRPFKQWGVHNTGWNDCCMFCERETLQSLGYRANPISPVRWVKRPDYSSGVGGQITVRLRKAGLQMYHADVFKHVGVDSKMNPHREFAL